MKLVSEKTKIFKELSQKHLEILGLKYDIESESLIELILNLLKNLAEAGKKINDKNQRNQLESYVRYWNLYLDQKYPGKYQKILLSPPEEPLENSSNIALHWGEAPVIKRFEGRNNDIDLLKKRIKSNCKVLTILGMGGIGKTFLARKLVEETKENFDKIFWMRLINAPKATEVLKEAIKFLSEHNRSGEGTFENQKNYLANYLQNYKCLIILDNIEAILVQGKEAGQYKEGYENYEQLIEIFGNIEHQSCLLLTSREKPKTIAILETPEKIVYSYDLGGLEYSDAKNLLQNTVKLKGAEKNFKELINQYQGIPLYLELVAKYISELYAGNIRQFLNDENIVFGDIRDFLDQHYNRLSEREKEIMNWLAINRVPISLPNV